MDRRGCRLPCVIREVVALHGVDELGPCRNCIVLGVYYMRGNRSFRMAVGPRPGGFRSV